MTSLFFPCSQGMSCFLLLSLMWTELLKLEFTNHMNMHCIENSKQIFPEMKFRGLVPNFCVHVSVSNLYIPTIGPPTFICYIAFADRSWEYINRSQIHECRNWEQGRAVSFLGIFVSNFRHSAFAVCWLAGVCKSITVGADKGGSIRSCNATCKWSVSPKLSIVLSWMLQGIQRINWWIAYFIKDTYISPYCMVEPWRIDTRKRRIRLRRL